LGTRATGGAGGNSPVGSDTPVAGWLCLNPNAQWTPNIAARFVYRRIQSPVGTARVPARACGPVGASSPLRCSPQACPLFRQARRVLHSPLPRVLAAGVEGGAAPLVPPPCPSPSSQQRSVFDTTPFPESSSQVGRLRRFEERSKERHERLKQEGVGGWYEIRSIAVPLRIRGFFV